MKQKGCRPNPPPPPPHHKGLWWHTNPILPSLQSNWINSLALVLIFTQKATPEVETHTYARKRVFASNWSELRPVSREQALGIEMPCCVLVWGTTTWRSKLNSGEIFLTRLIFNFLCPLAIDKGDWESTLVKKYCHRDTSKVKRNKYKRVFQHFATKGSSHHSKLTN